MWFVKEEIWPLYLLLTPVSVSSVGEVEVGFYRLWKASGKGGDNWYRSLGPKQAAVFNQQIHTLETSQLCAHPHTKTHTVSMFCGFCSQVVVSFLHWLL